MRLLDKINQIGQFVSNCIAWFQSKQINKIIESMKVYKVCAQFFLSFSSILLLMFFSKIPDKLKSKFEVVPIAEIYNNPESFKLKNSFRDYRHYIPIFQNAIVAEPYYFRN